MMTPRVTMREALVDPDLLGGAIPGESWAVWRALLIAAMGEALTEDERVLFTEVTGRAHEPLTPVDEWWNVVGRRGGKTRAAGVLAAYVATLCDHSAVLAPGERGVIPILAASVTQASRAFNHVLGIIEHSPGLCDLIESKTADTIRLSTSVDIEIQPANFRTVRGVTAVAAIADEVAFWMIEGSANPDSEVLDALRPSLDTTGGPLMVISSPFAKRGELYATYRRDYGAAGDPAVLVAKGPSKTFNPTLKQSRIDRAYRRDPVKARAEYGADFRNDLEAFVTLETVEACVSAGILEREPVAGITYKAFVDPSGGSSDSMTLAIGHMEGDLVVTDAVREAKAPFSPAAVTKEFCDLLKAYGVKTVTGDRYAGEWPREQFRKWGVEYLLSDQPKSTLYLGLLPRLNTTGIDLIDFPGLALQLANLERRVAWGGRESIDHAPGQHDDVANAVAGLARVLAGKAEQPKPAFGSYSSSAGPAFGGANALVGRYSGFPRPAAAGAPDDLPLPLWAREPRSEAAAVSAANYRSGRLN